MASSAASVRETLFSLQDPAYQAFQSKLCPGVDNIIGVRMPALRSLARKLARESGLLYFQEGPEDYYEELLLKAMVLGYTKGSLANKLPHIAAFVPKITNWAVCDCFCGALKVTREDPEAMLTFLRPYLSAPEEFSVRFAAVMLLEFYIDAAHISTILSLLADVTHPGYYAKMAVAWALSICYVKFPAETLPLLQEGRLDPFTHNKTLQKICESFRVAPQDKAMLRTLRRPLLSLKRK